MPASPPGRRSLGNVPSKTQRDRSKKDVALSKAQQKQEMVRKVMGKKLAEQQKVWTKQYDAALKAKKSVDKIMHKFNDDRTLDQRFLGLVKKFGGEMVKIDKQMSAFAKTADTPKIFTEVKVQVGKLPAPSTIQLYADLSLYLALLIVVYRHVLRLKISGPEKR